MSNVDDPQTNLNKIEAIRVHRMKFYQVLEAETLEDALTGKKEFSSHKIYARISGIY